MQNESARENSSSAGPLRWGKSTVLLDDLLAHLRQLLLEDVLVQLTLSSPRTHDDGTVTKVKLRPVDLQGQRLFQRTSLRENRESHENLSSEDAMTRLTYDLRDGYQQLQLHAVNESLHVRISRKGQIRVHRKQEKTAPAVTRHNREKQHVLSEGTPLPFLQAVGVMTAEGRVRAPQQKKFRQINRYLEFVRDIAPALPEQGPIRVVDFGCGKSSLTFALHHYLTHHLQREVDIVGLDLKSTVIDDCNRLAESLGLQGLRFLRGDIADYQTDPPVHLAISLHACDTATDAALAQAIRWQARVIFAVPCCQHELSQSMSPEFLPLLTRHGILKERLAAEATDAIRAELLEIHGYQTQVLEFIDLEHTPKNLLLRAIRREHQPDVSRHRQRLATLKQQLGISALALERALKDELVREIPKQNR